MRFLLLLVLAVALVAAACGDDAPSGAADTPPATATPPADAGGDETGDPGARPGFEQLVPEVVSRRPHDPTAFTQGLVLVDGRMFESTGIHGESGTSLREVDPASGEVIRRLDMGTESFFGEGLAAVDDRLIMLTWQDRVAFAFDRDTFELLGSYGYTTEGWGLCFDGERLVMSDGTATLTFRDPENFAELGTVEVTRDGVPLERLNELECVDGAVWANVWLTDDIVRIDPATGAVDAVVDASGLVDPHPRVENSAAVLNGIAYDADAGTFLLTGKLWPELVEVRFVPADEAGAEDDGSPAGTATDALGPVASAGCALAPPPVGVETVTTTSAGLERSYRRFVPSEAASSEPMPVVMNFHGFIGTAENQASLSAFEDLAEREGVVVVHPQGTVLEPLGLTYWNIGLGAEELPGQVDDVAFVADLLDELEASLCIDTSRIYATGLSNGGYFSGRLACDLSERIAAVAGVAAIFHPEDCDPQRPVPVLEIHGTADEVVPFEGGDSVLAGDASLLSAVTQDPFASAIVEAFFSMSMPEEMAEWAAVAGCAPEPATVEVTENVSLWRWVDCTADVELYVVDGGGHTWPGSELMASVGSAVGVTTTEIDATEVIWEFFSRQRLG